MDKKTILGIVVVAVLFLGFAYVNTKQQEKYQQEMAAWQAYHGFGSRRFASRGSRGGQRGRRRCGECGCGVR